MRKIFIIIVSILILQISACAPTKPSFIKTPDLLPPAREVGNVDIALVLGGGGSKSIAHLGVLEVLEKNGIKIDLIVGTSAGSAVGAMYADQPSAVLLKNKLMSVKTADLLDPSISEAISGLKSIKGAIPGYSYEKFFLDNLTTKNIEDLKIPFVAVAVNADTNQLFLMKSGPIAPAIHASSAIPPFFSPVKIYGRTLIDGGVIAPVPVDIAKTYQPKLIISVDITAPASRKKLNNMIDLTYRSIEIYYYELARMQSRTADIDIHPNTDGYGMFEDNKKEELYQAGVNAAENMMVLIKQKMKELKIKPKK